jgi:PAS domain S-box-containing protein
MGLLHPNLQARAQLRNTGTQDARKTKEQLISELRKLRLQVENSEHERKDVEVELRQSLADFAESQRVAHLGGWVWDIVGGTTTWSDELYNIFGITPEQLDGNAYDAFLDFIHPQDRDHVDRAMQAALADRSHFCLEYRIVRPEGTVRTVEARAAVICDEARLPAKMLGVSQDITERKQVEEKLKWELRVNAALAALASNLVGLPHSLQKTAEIVLVQARALTDSDHGYVSLIDPQNSDNIICACTTKEARSSRFPKRDDGRYGGPWGHALDIKKAFFTSAHPSSRGTLDEESQFCTLLSVPVMMGGEILGQIALACPESAYTDKELDAVKRIGELYALALQRHRMNAELMEHQENLQGLVEHRTAALVAANESLRQLSNAIEQTADTVLITDREGVIEYVNPAFEKTTGYTEEEVLAQTPRMLKSGKHDVDYYKKLWSTLLHGEPWRATIVNRRKDGEIYWAEQTITPIRDEAGEITHFVSVLKDVTEQRKRQEQEFQMRLAQEVQQRYYQQAVPPMLKGFDIAGAAYPADTVGGDYLDFIPMEDGCLGMAVGDVTGHGFGSSLIMAETRAYLRSYAKSEADVGKILTRVNEAISADLEDGRFVTMVLSRLDPNSRSFVYASAGHVSGYLLDCSGEVVRVLESTCCPLGLFSGCKVASSEVIPMQPGQLLVFFTDGIMEAMAPDETEFGVERALELIRSSLHKPAQETVENVYRAIRNFAGNQPQQDDITAMICKLDGADSSGTG